MDNKHCRFCGHILKQTFADLGLSPLANEYLNESNLQCGQTNYPLKVQVCEKCFLVQADQFQKSEQIFGNYHYFSSYSKSWLKHCKSYVDMIITRLELDTSSKVLEVACNDGYLLQYFLPYHIPVKGIEPAETVAKDARAKGIDVLCHFFEEGFARELRMREGAFDLVIGNNVLAHVPDINSFVEGLRIVLSPRGTITMEFPHLMRLIQQCQFDTIYHEHFYYLSLLTVQEIFAKHGLTIYDVEELPTHGGSLRIYATHTSNRAQKVHKSVFSLIDQEHEFGIDNISTYRGFSDKMLKIKLNAVHLFSKWKQEGKRIAAFGAAAKGNTFLNYCGLDADVIDYVVDSNPHKQNLFLPGSLIPIVDQTKLCETKPDYLLILPWNLQAEIMNISEYVREWGCKFVTCIPQIQILE